MLVPRGFGYAIYDSLKEGALTALGRALSGFIIVAFIFYFLSVCIKPGFPLYLISSPRGQGLAVVILCHSFTVSSLRCVMPHTAVDEGPSGFSLLALNSQF